MNQRQRGITIKDVARKAGVSTATVSRVINHDPRVTEKTRALVHQCMQETGYTVNPIARSLRSQKSHTIGILAPEFQNDFFMAVAEGIESVLRLQGYTTFIVNSSEHIDQERERLGLLVEKQVDGAIIIPASDEGEHFSILKEAGIPYVFVDRTIAGLEHDCVLTDNTAGAFKAVRACIEDGAKKIGIIAGDQKLTSARERFEGYKQALRASDIEIREDLISFGNMHVQSGYDAAAKLLERHPDLTHLFIVNLFMRIGAEKYLAEQKGLSGVRIAAFDLAAISPLFTHSYITICQPLEQIGTRAADLLLSRIRREDLEFPQIYRLMPKILIHEFQQQ